MGLIKKQEVVSHEQLSLTDTIKTDKLETTITRYDEYGVPTDIVVIESKEDIEADVDRLTKELALAKAKLAKFPKTKQ